MGENANGTSTPATQPGVGSNSDGAVEEVGPLSILPICVTLLAVVALAIAACVFYRRRQRQQEQVLARQLRVTERRIGVVGSLRVKKLAARKTLYHPPTDVRASASEPSVINRPLPAPGAIRPHYVIRAYQPQQYGAKLQTTLVNTSACSCEYGQSTYCSTCKEEEERNRVSRRDVSAGSLAVELATVPSVGSMTTIHTLPQQPGIRRTRSEHTAGPRDSVELVQLLQLGSVMSTPGKDDATASKHIHAWLAKSSKPASISTGHPHPLPPALSELPGTMPPWRGEYISMTVTTASEQEPHPNTPVSHSTATSEDRGATDRATDRALSYVSEDAQSEKWV